MNRLRPTLSRQEGFTLAELLVAVAVVGILLAVAVPTYLGFTSRASATTGAANARITSVTRAADDAIDVGGRPITPAIPGAEDGAALPPAPSTADRVPGPVTRGRPRIKRPVAPAQPRPRRPAPPRPSTP
jgi:prepilin-type N-terminal cleavage/methylation domain-containing protein